MVEGKQVAVIDDKNEVSYYAAKSPATISNRDFLSMRGWRESVSDSGAEYVVASHSTEHADCPPKKGFIRGHIIRTCYYVSQDPENAENTVLNYVTQSDPKGWIPAWLVNKLAGKIGPQVIETMYKACKGYAEWSKEQYGENGSWKTAQAGGHIDVMGDAADYTVTEDDKDDDDFQDADA